MCSPHHGAIVGDLAAALPYLENTQLCQLMKIFVEAYVLNAPPARRCRALPNPTPFRAPVQASM